MSGYGQFCPMALATEIVGERWTLLVLREMMKGAARFNDIHRGVPRMSPALLSKRLRRLEQAGIVERRRESGGPAYRLTAAGSELERVVEGLAVWGKQWLPASLSAGNADPDLLMWDMHRELDAAQMPPTRTVIRFDFADQPPRKRLRWVLASAAGAELCITDPGYEVDLYVGTDAPTMVAIWHGDIALGRAIDRGLVQLDGPRPLRAAFTRWLRPGPLAEVPRREGL